MEARYVTSLRVTKLGNAELKPRSTSHLSVLLKSPGPVLALSQHPRAEDDIAVMWSFSCALQTTLGVP
jgi:hypothetical protein